MKFTTCASYRRPNSPFYTKRSNDQIVCKHCLYKQKNNLSLHFWCYFISKWYEKTLSWIKLIIYSFSNLLDPPCHTVGDFSAKKQARGLFVAFLRLFWMYIHVIIKRWCVQTVFGIRRGKNVGEILFPIEKWALPIIQSYGGRHKPVRGDLNVDRFGWNLDSEVRAPSIVFGIMNF